MLIWQDILRKGNTIASGYFSPTAWKQAYSTNMQVHGNHGDQKCHQNLCEKMSGKIGHGIFFTSPANTKHTNLKGSK